MSATEFVGLVNGFIFLVIFIVTVARAIRLRTTPSIEIAAFFGIIVAIQQLGTLLDLVGLGETRIASLRVAVLLPLLPYLLIRITDHFTALPRGPRVAALAVTLGVMAAGVAAPAPMPTPVAVLVAGWVVVGGAYASVVFVREAGQAIGVTSRRLQAAAIGSGLLALALIAAIAGLPFPELADVTTMATGLLATGCGIAYYAGFATPTWLRRTWQEPAVRGFLSHSADLTREPDEGAAVRRMALLIARVMGTQHAVIGLADAAGTTLRWMGADGNESESATDKYLAGRAYTTGQVLLSRDAARDDPVNAEAYHQAGAGTIIAAPVSSGERKYGVLVAYASRAPVFAYSDRDMAMVLAQQAGTIIEARELLREAAEVQARDVATRAKEDFLSAAAHDLRTPLSSMVLRAELLQRRLRREASPHADAVDQVLTDASRVADFVEDLLDAARAEQGRLTQASEAVDLAALAREVVDDRLRANHEITVTAGPAWVIGDRRRLRQVLENLVGNAQKYSPGGEPITIDVSSDGELARVSVRDHGIGVTPEDLPNLFQRFNRGRNVDDRRFSGLGLGLYICRRIVEEHGGRIWAESEVGTGTTMRFEVPASTASSSS